MMHIIESEEVAKTLASLAPLTRLSRNDAHNSTYIITLVTPFFPPNIQLMTLVMCSYFVQMDPRLDPDQELDFRSFMKDIPFLVIV